MKIYDISMNLKEGMIIYPNNPGFTLQQVSFLPNDSSNNSMMIMGTHTGTHVDSLKHVKNSSNSVDKVKLDNLIGKCRVLDLTYVKSEISLEDLKNFNIKKGERLLFKTKNYKFMKIFNKNFVKLNVEAARYLADKKIRCLGVDYLSSGNHEVHLHILKYGTIIEGLNLSKVKAGEYDLCCLPLKLIDAEAAPARAILVKR